MRAGAAVHRIRNDDGIRSHQSCDSRDHATAIGTGRRAAGVSEVPGGGDGEARVLRNQLKLSMRVRMSGAHHSAAAARQCSRVCSAQEAVRCSMPTSAGSSLLLNSGQRSGRSPRRRRTPSAIASRSLASLQPTDAVAGEAQRRFLRKSCLSRDGPSADWSSRGVHCATPYLIRLAHLHNAETRAFQQEYSKNNNPSSISSGD